MAKPHRMFVLIAACAASLFEGLWGGDSGLMAGALWGVALLSLYTAGARLRRIGKALKILAANPDARP